MLEQNSHYFLPLWLTLHYTQTTTICKNLEKVSKNANTEEFSRFVTMESNIYLVKQVFDVWLKL